MSSELLAPGEEIDCGIDDDAENARRLIRVLNTAIDGHDFEWWDRIRGRWFPVHEVRELRIPFKFRRVA